MRDPYQVLGVAKSASEAEIKKAFRNLAKKHHPDTHAGDETAKKRFQEISAAYDIVGDKDKRAKFDAGEIDAGGNPRGFDPRAGGFRGNPFGSAAGRGQAATANSISAGTISGGEAQGFSAEDIFSDLMGGGAGVARASPSGARRGFRRRHHRQFRRKRDGRHAPHRAHQWRADRCEDSRRPARTASRSGSRAAAAPAAMADPAAMF